MSVVTTLLFLALIGVLLYVFERYAPMDATIKQVIRLIVYVIVVLVVFALLAQLLGVSLPVANKFNL